MRTTTFATMLIAGLLSPSLFAAWQDEAPKDALINQLQKQYPLTKLSADGKDVVTAGSIFTLKKDGLVLTPTDSSDVSGNSYKAGKITQSAAGKANEKAKKVKSVLGHFPIPGASSTAAAPTNDTRTFVAGEKLNITKIVVKDGAAVFGLCSAKAYSDVYYHGSLTFPVDKGTVPAADAMLATTGEVFSVDPPEDTKTAPAAAEPAASGVAAPDPPKPIADPTPPPATVATPDAPALQKYADIPPPPPPAAPPQAKLELGQSVDEVVAQLGQPVTSATIGDKQIYLFEDWKVTFTKGKVTDIDVR
jgi:hypothetical protein